MSNPRLDLAYAVDAKIASVQGGLTVLADSIGVPKNYVFRATEHACLDTQVQEKAGGKFGPRYPSVITQNLSRLIRGVGVKIHAPVDPTDDHLTRARFLIWQADIPLWKRDAMMEILRTIEVSESE